MRSIVALGSMWVAFGCHTVVDNDAPARVEPVLTQTFARVPAAPVHPRPPQPLSAAAGLACLRQAYPDSICSTEANAIVLCDGTRLTYDDGREKSHEERLERPDLEDTLVQPYDFVDGAPEANVEPGRVRSTAFFDAIYGDSAQRVRARLTRISWMPHTAGRSLLVTTLHGVDQRVRAVSDALERLPASIRRHAAEVAGTFNFRDVRGTDRKSAHSYGIAIDVAPALADYWRWREPGVDPPRRYRNRVPREIVSAFEREGFIWGGRWSHYDTMHFEYRPELLLPACRFAPAPERDSEGGSKAGARKARHGPTADAPVQTPAENFGVRAADSEGEPKSAAHRQVASANLGLRDNALAGPPAYPWLANAPAPSSTLRARIPPPPNFTRVPVAAGSFGAFLRDLPLRDRDEILRLYDGRAKPRQSLHAAIVDIDVGKRDLQQCADAVMRLRAEYLFASGRANEVCFRGVSGDPLPYQAYREGRRPPQGKAGPWRPAAAADHSHAGFRTYLDRVFGIANTASLLRELDPVANPAAIDAGDVYIEAASGGRFGHAVLVLDVAQDAQGERVFLIAQSYMPAQQFHVLINPSDRALSPWFRAPTDGSLRTPEWEFPPGALRRFGRSCQPAASIPRVRPTE